MNNTVTLFEIQSSQPEREVAFYSAVFGWKFEKQEMAPIEYYHFDTGGVYGGLMKRMTPVPPAEMGTNAFTCTFEVKNFDETAAEILKQGGQTAMPKFAIKGRCWQGYFLDADNNVFGISQLDNNAE